LCNPVQPSHVTRSTIPSDYYFTLVTEYVTSPAINKNNSKPNCAEQNIRPDWKYALNENGGRIKFQQEAAIGLIEKGIRMDWIDIQDKSKRPKWMRTKGFIPCNYEICFSVKNASQME